MIDSAGKGTVLALWIAFAITAIIGILLFCGFGTRLIAGYNTASAQEKAKYNKKRLSIVFGCGMSVLSVFLLMMAIFVSKLPIYTIYIFQGVVIIDCITVIILANKICKNR